MVVLTQGNVYWDLCRDENNSVIMNKLNKKILTAAEANAPAERQEEEMSVSKVLKKEEQKMANAIYSRLAQMTQKFQEKRRI